MSDQFSAEEMEIRFTHHPPAGGQVERYKDIRDNALEFANLLCGRVPASRELALALTKLEECVMHANSGIARRET